MPINNPETLERLRVCWRAAVIVLRQNFMSIAVFIRQGSDYVIFIIRTYVVGVMHKSLDCAILFIQKKINCILMVVHQNIKHLLCVLRTIINLPLVVACRFLASHYDSILAFRIALRIELHYFMLTLRGILKYILSHYTLVVVSVVLTSVACLLLTFHLRSKYRLPVRDLSIFVNYILILAYLILTSHFRSKYRLSVQDLNAWQPHTCLVCEQKQKTDPSSQSIARVVGKDARADSNNSQSGSDSLTKNIYFRQYFDTMFLYARSSATGIQINGLGLYGFQVSMPLPFGDLVGSSKMKITCFVFFNFRITLPAPLHPAWQDWATLDLLPEVRQRLLADGNLPNAGLPQISVSTRYAFRIEVPCDFPFM